MCQDGGFFFNFLAEVMIRTVNDRSNFVLKTLEALITVVHSHDQHNDHDRCTEELGQPFNSKEEKVSKRVPEHEITIIHEYGRNASRQDTN